MKKISFKFPQTARLKEAKKIAETVNFHGGKAFIVGGAVRDMYLGKEVKDIDIVCTLLPQKLIEIFPNSQLVGVVFGVIIVKVNEYNFEIATAREERNYLDGRHPELIVATDDLKVDSQRRDFTINALLYDFINEEIIDYQGGLKDLDNGIIRAVGDANLRFNEDYLRMLRLIRFASRLNFKIEEKTFDALKKNAHLCGILATERVKKELDLMFNHRNASLALEYLSCSGLLKVILPEIELLRNLPQNPVYHPEGDVFEHTL